VFLRPLAIQNRPQGGDSAHFEKHCSRLSSVISTVTAQHYYASGRERDAGRLYESGYKKRMEKIKTVL